MFPQRRNVNTYYIDPIKQIFLKPSNSTAFSKFSFVAAIILVSTNIDLFQLTGRISPSCRNRKSFTGVEGNVSPISSNKIVPLCLRNNPTLSLMAPVKAPLTCPNNPLFLQVLRQCTTVNYNNGPSLRGLS